MFTICLLLALLLTLTNRMFFRSEEARRTMAGFSLFFIGICIGMLLGAQ